MLDKETNRCVHARVEYANILLTSNLVRIVSFDLRVNRKIIIQNSYGSLYILFHTWIECTKKVPRNSGLSKSQIFELRTSTEFS